MTVSFLALYCNKQGGQCLSHVGTEGSGWTWSGAIRGHHEAFARTPLVPLLANVKLIRKKILASNPSSVVCAWTMQTILCVVMQWGVGLKALAYCESDLDKLSTSDGDTEDDHRGEVAHVD
jgi:hypothetical protein